VAVLPGKTGPPRRQKHQMTGIGGVSRGPCSRRVDRDHAPRSLPDPALLLRARLPPLARSLGLQLVEQSSASRTIAVCMLELAWALTTEDTVGPVAEVEAAHPAGPVRAAAWGGVVAGVTAAAAWCAIDQDGELVGAEGLVLCAEAALCGGEGHGRVIVPRPAHGRAGRGRGRQGHRVICGLSVSRAGSGMLAVVAVAFRRRLGVRRGLLAGPTGHDWSST
jgi:hypothetical protein